MHLIWIHSSNLGIFFHLSSPQKNVTCLMFKSAVEHRHHIQDTSRKIYRMQMTVLKND